MSGDARYEASDTGVHSGVKIRRQHLERMAYIYVRQSSLHQVENNRESAMRQYQRVEWAIGAGWSRERVVVVDDDQGTTAALPHSRPGFARMARAVVAGEVGVVIGLEGARLARNGPDWAELLFLCRWTDTLIADEHGVYDMTHPPDRMVLGIRGQVSELELDTSIERMVKARQSKAQRGELMVTPPAGFDVDDSRQLILARDEAVVEAIQTVFMKFDELGSARQVWLWWLQQGLEYPVRRPDLRSHPIAWKAVTYRMVRATLCNPIYAGAYVYGRTQTQRELDPEDPRKLRVRSVAREEPTVVIRDHHPGYVTWERFLEIQNEIRNNKAMSQNEDEGHPGAVREGRALLQGLVRCGQCGRRMNVSYGGSARGAKGRTPQYRCWLARQSLGGTDCQVAGTKRLDEWVIAAFLEATQPVSLEVVTRAEELARQQSEDLARVWALQVEKAEYEVQRAERQYHAVEPENRLVVRTLERQWEERMQALAEVRARAAAAGQQRRSLDEQECQRLRTLAVDVEAVWNAPTTKTRDHKALLRCLIEEVQLRSESERYRLRIVWKGGAVTDGEVPRHRRGTTTRATPEDTIELVGKLAVELDDTQIARVLNKQGRRTGRDNTFTRVLVASLRHNHGIPAFKRQQARQQARDPREGPFTADEAADELGVQPSTIHRWLRQGLLPGRQVTPGAPWQIRLTDDVRRRLTSGDAPAGWVGLTEAARRLGLTKSHVAYLVKSGKIPAVRTTVAGRLYWKIDVESATCGLQPQLL